MQQQSTARGPRPGEEMLDLALASIHGTSPYWAGELASHAPMAAEALVELGHADRIAAFLASCSHNFEDFTPLPPREHHDWLELRGRRREFPVLLAHFEAWLERAGVSSAVEQALPHLFPGVLAASLHGLLRVAHGLSAWSRLENSARRREIAFA